MKESYSICKFFCFLGCLLDRGHIIEEYVPVFSGLFLLLGFKLVDLHSKGLSYSLAKIFLTQPLFSGFPNNFEPEHNTSNIWKKFFYNIGLQRPHRNTVEYANEKRPRYG
jgi:hypothetical protein